MNETQLESLVINHLSFEKYNSIEEPNPNELYFVPDDITVTSNFP